MKTIQAAALGSDQDSPFVIRRGGLFCIPAWNGSGLTPYVLSAVEGKLESPNGAAITRNGSMVISLCSALVQC
jgi:hypothetical protein